MGYQNSPGPVPDRVRLVSAASHPVAEHKHPVANTALSLVSDEGPSA